MNKRVTMSDVAKRAKMSRATVSAVLGNKEHCFASEATKIMIKETASEMGYIPNLLARGLKNGRTFTIGLIESSIQNEVKQQEVVQFTNLLSERGYRLYVSYYKGEERLLRQACEDLLARGSDALIISGRCEPAEYQIVNKITNRAIFITSNFLDGERERTISSDYSVGIMEAGSYLHDTLGHRDIRMLGRYWNTFFQDSRVLAFQKMLKQFDLPIDNAIQAVAQLTEITPGFMKKFFTDSPDCTAIICSNDLVAMKVIQSCTKIGIAVPKDISVIGFDDIEASSCSTPPLTTIQHPLAEVASEAFKLLMNMLEDSNNLVCHRLPARLVIRESCDAPRNKDIKL
ncbi:MAG: LacI family DNA-binding transcriptional regulator [Victivallaceae bacterium]|nr:LacI family DNA-binding transcriptional regulator [Victivallaceae bacterium]